MRKVDTKGWYCQECKGFLWKSTLLEPEDLKKAMSQIGIIKRSDTDIRIQSFISNIKCKGPLEERVIGV